jgi:hypothetical protein
MHIGISIESDNVNCILAYRTQAINIAKANGLVD